MVARQRRLIILALSSVLFWATNSVLGEETTIMTPKEYSFADLPLCSLTSVEIANLGPDEELEPCIVFNVEPSDYIGDAENVTTFTIPIVQVTPAFCGTHRDGTVTGVNSLNGDNDGRGVAIGYRPGAEQGEDLSLPVSSSSSSRYVQFHLVSVVAGNPAVLTEEEYDRRHGLLLSSMLETLQAPYIVGSCSFASAMEKEPANRHKAILMAQVGPPGFYEDSARNPYVFGFHINSDTYPLHSVQSLTFWGNNQPGGLEKVPVRVISRTKSEFFSSTCQSAIAALQLHGFTDLEQYWIDHAADEDGDGNINQFDEDFLRNVADRACPPTDTGHEENFHPALFVCTLTEHDILIHRWLETGCRPVSLWVTASTWGWADDHPELVPYFQGGGQWHEALTYSDKFFASGKELIEYNEQLFGYRGNYDQVVSYAIPVLYAEHLVSTYRVADDPDPVADFASEEGRELLRRDMVVLTADSIFGPISFNARHRNVGRGAACSQWLRRGESGLAHEEVLEREELLQEVAGVDNAVSSSGSSSALVSNDLATTSSLAYTNTLVAPFLQAKAASVVPAPSAQLCRAGNFANQSSRMAKGSILRSGCSECPVDMFLPLESLAFECWPCPAGSATNGLTGRDACDAVDDNLLSSGILVFGYFMVAVSWLLGVSFLIWIWIYRDDPVVKVSQVQFLILICIGAMISSSTIIALSFQAGSNEDTSQASAGCTVAPFLYAIGWALQYSSLTAKTYRLFLVMKNNQKMRRVKVTFQQTFGIVVIVLAINLAVLIAWTLISPLVYERSEEAVNVNANAGVITIETVGSCVMKDETISFWAFAAPLMAFHFFLLVLTNALLCMVRDVSDRYQEQRYIGLSSMLMFEILIVGLPVLVAVNDSPVARHIILIGLIALADIGVLCFTFIPKICYQCAGLQEGVGIGESIMKESYARASSRECMRRDSRFESGGSRHGSGSDCDQRQMNAEQMASAAAVVRSGSFVIGTANAPWADSLNSSTNEFAGSMDCSSLNPVIPGVEEEMNSEVQDFDPLNRSTAKRSSVERLPSLEETDPEYYAAMAEVRRAQSELDGTTEETSALTTQDSD